jgi:fucose permease
MASRPLSRPALAAILGCASLLLVGWTGLLVPSLIRSIEGDLGATDAAIGIFFLVNSIAYAGGSVVGGLLIERFGRRVILPLAIVLIVVGMVGMASAPTVAAFVVLGIPRGLGGGAVDGGVNGLVLDLYPTSRGRALNLLHLFFSLGAFASPLVVGRLVEGGASWQAVMAGTALAAVPLAILLAAADLPSGHHARTPNRARPRITLAVPLIALAVAIACYVAAEVGVSDWLVRFLVDASVGLATAALAAFWGCLTLGRVVSAVVADRFDHAAFAAIASLVAAMALVGAILIPSLPASIVLFGVVGFAFGPVYPLIMAVAGDHFPDRTAAVAGFLAAASVIGAVIYPPLMGFMSVGVGLGVAMGGTAVLSLVCAIVLALFRRRSSWAAVPTIAPASGSLSSE